MIYFINLFYYLTSRAGPVPDYQYNVAMVQLQKKMSFAVDPGELPVPICLPDCQTECKTKWGRRFANEIEEEEITVQNPKFDDSENRYEEHVSKLHTYVGCRNVYPSLKRFVC